MLAVVPSAIAGTFRSSCTCSARRRSSARVAAHRHPRRVVPSAGRWLRRVAFRTLLVVVVPAWLLMRVAGQWIDSKEDIPGDPTWLGIGYIVGDLGLVILVARYPDRVVAVRAARIAAGR